MSRVRWAPYKVSKQQLKEAKSSGGMYHGIVRVGRERNPLIPVGLILVYIMSQVLSQHTMDPLNTPLRFRMKHSKLNFLDLKDLAGVSKNFTNEVSALISL
jgi:hypothetical protein